MAAADFITALTEIMPKDRVYTDTLDCYAYDNSLNYHVPIAVVFPLNVEKI